MEYIYHLSFMVLLYTILAFSLNVTLGFGGLLSLCHAAFYGVGAYGTALLMQKWGWAFFPALVGSILLSGILAAAAAFPALRFRGDRFVLVTLALQAIIFSTLLNWVELTSGPYGLSGIPRPILFGYRLRDPSQYLALTILFTAIIGVVLWRFHSSQFGLSLRALREDERAAVSLGIDAASVYRRAFVLSALIAAVPGGIYATYVTYIDPSSFTLAESILIASIVLIGGGGKTYGPIWGALIVVLLPQALTFLGLPPSVAAHLRQAIYGMALVGLMFVRPQGISGEYSPS